MHDWVVRKGMKFDDRIPEDIIEFHIAPDPDEDRWTTLEEFIEGNEWLRRNTNFYSPWKSALDSVMDALSSCRYSHILDGSTTNYVPNPFVPFGILKGMVIPEQVLQWQESTGEDYVFTSADFKFETTTEGLILLNSLLADQAPMIHCQRNHENVIVCERNTVPHLSFKMTAWRYNLDTEEIDIPQILGAYASWPKKDGLLGYDYDRYLISDESGKLVRNIRLRRMRSQEWETKNGPITVYEVFEKGNFRFQLDFPDIPWE